MHCLLVVQVKLEAVQQCQQHAEHAESAPQSRVRNVSFLGLPTAISGSVKASGALMITEAAETKATAPPLAFVAVF
jgi:hypothetical protein